MRANIEDYYRLFNDRDAERVAQFDEIVDAPQFGEELKAKLLEWYSTAKSSVPGLGDRGAKVLVMSIVELATMTPDEITQAIAIGRAVNSAAPKEWRLK